MFAGFEIDKALGIVSFAPALVLLVLIFGLAFLQRITGESLSNVAESLARVIASFRGGHAESVTRTIDALAEKQPPTDGQSERASVVRSDRGTA